MTKHGSLSCPKNNIFFINWSKIKSSTKDVKVLRKESELTSGDYGVFDEFIINTKNKISQR